MLVYDNKTYESIKDTMLSKVNNVDKREGSFVNDMLSPIALELEGAYQQFNRLLGVMFLEDVTGEYLEKRAAEYGMTRKDGTYATGSVKFTGVDETVIPKGSLVSTVSNLIYETVGEVVIADGQAIAEIKSQAIGDKYNVMANAINQIPVNINNIFTVTNESNILGGTDVEKDEQLLSRLLLQIQNPATSGNAMHYKLWALEVDGVGDARVFPLHNGAGTVMVLPITADKRTIDDSIKKNVFDHIEANRPIGATITVEKPVEVLINVDAQLVLDSAYTIQQVKASYAKKLNEYIQASVFKLYTIDYFKCLSIFYDIEGVKQVIEFKLNNGSSNVTIGETQIQVTGTITVEEGA